PNRQLSNVDHCASGTANCFRACPRSLSWLAIEPRLRGRTLLGFKRQRHHPFRLRQRHENLVNPLRLRWLALQIEFIGRPPSGAAGVPINRLDLVAEPFKPSIREKGLLRRLDRTNLRRILLPEQSAAEVEHTR